MHEQQVQVSILMPVYNATATLARSVASVQAQTFRDWELLMVDDGSTDGSVQLAADLAASDPRIRCLTLPENCGAAVARNHGLDAAKGRYITFLDTDDLWRPEKLSRQLEFMSEHDSTLSFTGYSRVSKAGALIVKIGARRRVEYPDLLKRNVIGCLTVMYDSTRLGKVPMPTLRRQHDYALWLQLTRLVGAAEGLNEDLAIYRVSMSSLSGNKWRAAQDIWRVYRQCEKLSLPSSIWYFAHYTFYGFRYRLIQRARRNAPVVGLEVDQVEGRK